MSRNGYRGPKLPRVLLDRVQSDSSFKSKGSFVSRKDRRRTERQDKNSQRFRGRAELNGKAKLVKTAPKKEREDFEDSDSDEPAAAPVKQSPNAASKPTPIKSISKKSTTSLPSESEEESGNAAEEGDTPASELPRGVKRKLEDDDAEIAALEKRLGIKGKKSKALETDGLNWLVDGSDDDSSVGLGSSSKHKTPGDAQWLREKRMKASKGSAGILLRERAKGTPDSASSENDTDDEDGIEEASDASSLQSHTDDAEYSEDFGGFDSEDGAASELDNDHTKVQAKRLRENPYVPPVASTAKYIPPSLRKPASSDEELLRQLRRQVQGLLNRLSEANMLSILKSIEELYASNARQHITSTVIDLLVGLVTDPSTLNDTFLVLHAGFSTALYKTIGTDFGAHLLEKIVGMFDHHRSRRSNGKQTLNLLAFLSNLYTFQLAGSGLIFDYIRLLLQELSEDNTELLLRVMRTSGQQLRQDDPSSLKDIVLLLQRSVAAVGEAALSVRTKFMIETINDLKNNRTKSGAATSAMVSEHTTRMKKILSSLSTSRPIKASEPLRITLSDIRDSEKKGKWWLVGASYLDPNKHQHSTAVTSIPENDDAGYESETPGSVNLHRLARTQGMNTDVRRAIFTTTLSSSDYKEAHLRLLKLHLKPKQQLEIPRVLSHCVGIETAYNPFYALVARQFCSEHRLRKAFEFTLWDAFHEMENTADDEEETGMETSKILNLARFYAFLVANRTLDIRVLKKLELTSLSSQQSTFVEMCLTTVLILVRKNRSHATGQEGTVKEIFARVAGVEGLPQGLLLFIEQTVVNADFARGQFEHKAVRTGCEYAVEALREAASKTAMVEQSGEDDDDY